MKGITMGKFVNALKIVGEVLEATAETNKEIDEMTYKLMQKTYGVDLDQAKQIARVLVTQADVTWK